MVEVTLRVYAHVNRVVLQAFHEGKCIGTIVCKMGQHRNTFRGYIAMLVVVKQHRGKGIGKNINI
jgi:GNAT superfamily N-acetyltransferase